MQFHASYFPMKVAEYSSQFFLSYLSGICTLNMRNATMVWMSSLASFFSESIFATSRCNNVFFFSLILLRSFSALKRWSPDSVFTFFIISYGNFSITSVIYLSINTITSPCLFQFRYIPTQLCCFPLISSILLLYIPFIQSMNFVTYLSFFSVTLS